VILKTLISLLRCVWLRLELNSAGQWPSRTEFEKPCFSPTSSLSGTYVSHWVFISSDFKSVGRAPSSSLAHPSIFSTAHLLPPSLPPWLQPPSSLSWYFLLPAPMVNFISRSLSTSRTSPSLICWTCAAWGLNFLGKGVMSQSSHDLFLYHILFSFIDSLYDFCLNKPIITAY